MDGVLGEDLIKWASIRFTGIHANLEPPKDSVSKVHLQDAFARLTLETNHTLNLLAALQPMHTNSVAAAPAENKETKAGKGTKKALAQVKGSMNQTNAFGITNLLKLNVGTIVISNAQLELSDRSMTPNVHMSVQSIN